MTLGRTKGVAHQRHLYSDFTNKPQVLVGIQIMLLSHIQTVMNGTIFKLL